MAEPLSSERLAEIRDLNVDSCSADAPYNPDVWALEATRRDLLAEVDRLKAANKHLERDWESRGNRVLKLGEDLRAAEVKLWAAAQVRVWTNEDGKRFVFADDLCKALGVPSGGEPRG